MFFIFGFGRGKKLYPASDTVICSQCGGYGRYQLIMTYSYFSLFFLRILKWNCNYFLEFSCCNALYQLSAEAGKQLAGGNCTDIEGSMTLVRGGNGGFGRPRKRCGQCGFEMDSNYDYCPKCGLKL